MRGSSAGRDATVEVKVKFQKPNADTLPPTLDLGPFWGVYFALAVKSGFLIVVK